MTRRSVVNMLRAAPARCIAVVSLMSTTCLAQRRLYLFCMLCVWLQPCRGRPGYMRIKSHIYGSWYARPNLDLYRVCSTGNVINKGGELAPAMHLAPCDAAVAGGGWWCLVSQYVTAPRYHCNGNWNCVGSVSDSEQGASSIQQHNYTHTWWMVRSRRRAHDRRESE